MSWCYSMQNIYIYKKKILQTWVSELGFGMVNHRFKANTEK